MPPMTPPHDARIRTPQLDLVPGTAALADVELAGAQGLGLLFDCDVPGSWPPGEYDRGAIEYLRDRMLEGGPSHDGWYTWYGIARAAAGSRATLVAAGGYFGPPVDDIVEIGYSVVPEAQRRGLATEMAQALVTRAFGAPRVRAVIAHTLDTNPASIRVLERCGFRREGPGREAGTVQFRVARPA